MLVPPPDLIKKRYRTLYKELIVLNAIKKNNPKRFEEIRVQLRDLINDCAESFKDVQLSDDWIVEMLSILKHCRLLMQHNYL
ncbi:MAG: hypothetical protein ABIF10_04690 [Candidatus Woesearchaeota archaeon]